MSILNARTLAPFAAMGATLAARKGMSMIYVRRTGHAPPTPEDREVSIASVLGWAVTTAVVAAAIEVIVTRMAVNYSATHDELEPASPI